MSLRVHTATLASRDPDVLDCSRYGNDPLGVAFAPSAPLLHAYKRLAHQRRADACAWASFAAAYRDELRERYRAERAPFDALLARPRVVLACYCRDDAGGRCHRFLLASVLVRLGATYAGELDAVDDDPLWIAPEARGAGDASARRDVRAVPVYVSPGARPGPYAIDECLSCGASLGEAWHDRPRCDGCVVEAKRFARAWAIREGWVEGDG